MILHQIQCVVCGRTHDRGKKHKCSPKAIQKFERRLREKDGPLNETREPGFEEQLADGFAMLGESA